MTDLETADRFIKLIQTKTFKEQEVKEAYEELKKIGEMKIDDESHWIIPARICFFDKSLPDKEFYIGRRNYVYITYPSKEAGDFGYMLNEMFGDTVCAGLPFNKLLKELKGQYQIAVQENVGAYFLINPDREVVKWALEHKKELALDKANPAIVLKYQKYLRLRNLVFKTMGWRLEDID